jgi:hypothetical protein
MRAVYVWAGQETGMQSAPSAIVEIFLTLLFKSNLIKALPAAKKHSRFLILSSIIKEDSLIDIQRKQPRG